MTVEYLKRSPLFRDFSPVGLEILARIAQPKIVLSGQPLYFEGAPATAMYLLVEGRLRIVVKSPDGSDVALGSLAAGEHVAEMALLTTGAKPPVHLCSALAQTDCKLFEFSAAAFQALMMEKPQACAKLLIAVAQEFGQKAGEAREALRSLMARGLAR